MHTIRLIKFTLLFNMIFALFVSTARADYSYYAGDYEAFIAKGGPKCGSPDPASLYYDGWGYSYRLLTKNESCTVVIRARQELISKLHYWVDYRPIGKVSYRRISSVKTFSNKLKNRSEFLSFRMKGDGDYRIGFDSNANGYLDDSKYLGVFFEPTEGVN